MQENKLYNIVYVQKSSKLSAGSKLWSSDIHDAEDHKQVKV